MLHLHELLQYLNRQGAATFLTVAQHGMIGDMSQPSTSPISPTLLSCCAISRPSATCGAQSRS